MIARHLAYCEQDEPSPCNDILFIKVLLYFNPPICTYFSGLFLSLDIFRLKLSLYLLAPLCVTFNAYNKIFIFFDFNAVRTLFREHKL